MTLPRTGAQPVTHHFPGPPSALTGTSFIPHFGQSDALVSVTSGCIGQAYRVALAGLAGLAALAGLAGLAALACPWCEGELPLGLLQAASSTPPSASSVNLSNPRIRIPASFSMFVQCG